MKKNTTNKMSLRQLAARLRAWMHMIIEQKAEHLAECAWYPGSCQTEYPF